MYIYELQLPPIYHFAVRTCGSEHESINRPMSLLGLPPEHPDNGRRFAHEFSIDHEIQGHPLSYKHTAMRYQASGLSVLLATPFQPE